MSSDSCAGDDLDMTTVLANAVHEAKNALGMMLGSLDELDGRCGAGACGVPAGLERVAREGTRVNAALVRLLALYRMDTGGYRLNPAEHDVDECLTECVLEHASALEARGLEVENGPETGLDWHFDRELVASVLQGAVNNALRYARSTVTLSAETTSGWLVIRVADDGPGFPDALLEDAGTRALALDPACQGTGLGLYFAARVAAAHRTRSRTGRIALDNVGAGARFSLWLP